MIIFVGCDGPENSYKELDYSVMPPELKGCKVYKIRTSGPDPDLYVTKCPNCPNTTTDAIIPKQGIRSNSLIISEDI